MITLFGLPLRNWTMQEAVHRLLAVIETRPPQPQCVYFVNAHAATLAASDAQFKDVLARAAYLLVDGAGVRIAARLRGSRLKANLVGTDLLPALMQTAGTSPRSYFLLGSHDAINARAAAYAERMFRNWRLAGRHHGYLDEAGLAGALAMINAARPDILLVAMGNPKQEQWLDRHAAALDVAVCFAVGGLFDHWSGDLQRAPAWVRRLGFEWLQLTLQQPWKVLRYLHDIPVFLLRATIAAPRDRRLQQAGE